MSFEQILRFLQRLFASQILVFFVVLAWLNDYVYDPLVATGLIILSEIAGLGLVFAKKVWERLETDLVDATVDWIKGEALNFSPGFRRHYNTQVKFDHRVFNVRGLRTTGTFSLEVEKVFVELRVSPSSLSERNIFQ